MNPKEEAPININPVDVSFSVVVEPALKTKDLVKLPEAPLTVLPPTNELFTSPTFTDSPITIDLSALATVKDLPTISESLTFAVAAIVWFAPAINVLPTDPAPPAAVIPVPKYNTWSENVPNVFEVFVAAICK